jgi:hypothetical protein
MNDPNRVIWLVLAVSGLAGCMVLSVAEILWPPHK